LGVAGEYREQEILVAKDVVSIPLGKLGGEEKIILKCV
jgi:hypothetical protein